jgi:hypothetical protein
VAELLLGLSIFVQLWWRKWTGKPRISFDLSMRITAALLLVGALAFGFTQQKTWRAVCLVGVGILVIVHMRLRDEDLNRTMLFGKREPKEGAPPAEADVGTRLKELEVRVTELENRLATNPGPADAHQQ